MDDLKTTGPGLVAAVATALIPVLPHYAALLGVINAMALAVLGFFAKTKENG